jgi:hypothetical protein
MVRGPFTEDTLKLGRWLIDNGYQPVGLIGYWLHVIFPNRKKKIEVDNESPTSDH